MNQGENKSSSDAKTGLAEKKVIIPCPGCYTLWEIDHASGLESLKCESCGLELEIPGIPETPRRSLYYPELIKDSDEDENNFFVFCPYCEQRYDLPQDNEEVVMRCIVCSDFFIAINYKKLIDPKHAASSGSTREANDKAPSSSEKDTGKTQEGKRHGGVGKSQIHPVFEECSVCRTQILPEDEMIRCPSCKIPFHIECWEENYGCAAYGCDMVNTLKKDSKISINLEELPLFSHPGRGSYLSSNSHQQTQNEQNEFWCGCLVVSVVVGVGIIITWCGWWRWSILILIMLIICWCIYAIYNDNSSQE